MIKFLVRRLIFLIVTVFVASIAIFAISEIAPGNIARNTLGNTITPAQEQSFNAQNGLDQSPRHPLHALDDRQRLAGGPFDRAPGGALIRRRQPAL